VRQFLQAGISNSCWCHFGVSQKQIPDMILFSHSLADVEKLVRRYINCHRDLLWKVNQLLLQPGAR
jgi:hypothetical protein